MLSRISNTMLRVNMLKSLTAVEVRGFAGKKKKTRTDAGAVSEQETSDEKAQAETPVHFETAAQVETPVY